MSTDEAHAAARFEEWRYLIRKTFGFDFRSQFASDDARLSRLSVRGLGALRVSVMSTPPGQIAAHRTPTLIRRQESDMYGLQLPVSGGVVVAQNGREAVLWSGDFALCDVNRPVSIASTANTPQQLLVVGIPYGLLPWPRWLADELSGVRIPGREGAAALTSSLLVRLASHVDQDEDDYGAAGVARISAAVVDLLVAALEERTDSGTSIPPETRRRAFMRRIYAFIEERLSDPGLSPTMIAAAHHVSLRYLHKLFEGEKMGVAGWIRHRRLERCRRELADPTLRIRPVSTIGARWGYHNPAGFARAFRAAYGVPPSEYRSSLDVGNADHTT